MTLTLTVSGVKGVCLRAKSRLANVFRTQLTYERIGTPAFIGDDSVLRRLPTALPLRQVLFLDAMRVSIEMVDLAYSRLKETLLRITVATAADVELNEPLAAPFLDAWSIVDSTHRLRELLQQAPGFSGQAPGVQVFLRQTAQVEEARHVIQHLRGEVDELARKRKSVMGHLSWFAILDPSSEEGYIGQITIGAVFPHNGDPVVNPLGQPVVPPIDLVNLYIGELALNLSQLVQQVEALGRRLEESVTTAISEQIPADARGSTFGSDFAVVIRVSLRT